MRYVAGSGIKRHLLVDANNIIFKAFHIYVTTRIRAGLPLLRSKHGFETGVIYGFWKFLFSYMSDLGRFDTINVFFDGVSKYRRGLSESYKAQRESKDLYSLFNIELCSGHTVTNSFEILKILFKYAGFNVFHSSDHESDDLISNFITSCPEDIHIIISDDKDFFQCLVNPRVVIFRPGDPDVRLVDAEQSVSVWTRLNKGTHPPITPAQVRLFKSLCGDASDNIKGIPRLRKKIAATMSKNIDVETLYKSDFSGCSKSERDAISSSRDQIELNYLLVGFEYIPNIANFKTLGQKDVDMFTRILTDDCSIHNLQISLLKPPTADLKPNVPDWLASV